MFQAAQCFRQTLIDVGLERAQANKAFQAFIYSKNHMQDSSSH